MNILVFSWRDPKHPTAGGAEQVMHEHMKGWIAAGHSVTLFSSKIKGQSNSDVIDGVKIVRRGIQYFGVHIAGFFYYLRNSKKIDLVVDQFHGIPFFTPLYVFKPKLAVIQEIAGKVWLKNEFPFPLNLIIGMIGYIGEPFLFIFYKKIPFMTGSRSAKESLVSVGIPSKNIHIINHGVIVEKPKPMPKKEKNKTILFLGAISKDKGIGDVLKTFGLLNSVGNYKFWVMGKSSEYYAKLIDTTSKSLGFAKNLTYFGFVSQKKKFELLARAHVMINPSLVEGWGLVNIEANAMGTPVVAYNSAGLVDSVKNGVSGIICKANTPKALMEETKILLDNTALYNKLSVGAIGWSKMFHWDVSVKKSVELIESVYLN